MKKFYLFFVISLATFVSFAQESRVGDAKKSVAEESVGDYPITLNVSFDLASSSVANHFLSSNEYSGTTTGVHADLGRFYKSWNNVSWNLSLDYLASSSRALLENSAGTSSMDYSTYSLGYSSSYHWNFGKGFMVKAGGGIDLAYDMMEAGTYKTNNPASMNLFAQLEASAGASYVFQFKKWMLGITGNVSVPFLGLVNTDSKHESAMPSDGFMDTYDSHLKGTTFSNLQGFDLDLGLKFVLPRVTLAFGVVSNNRWWCVNDIQNYRRNSYLKLSFGFDLVGTRQTKTTKRYF
jgi:hypothetical protein